MLTIFDQDYNNKNDYHIKRKRQRENTSTKLESIDPTSRRGTLQ